VEPSLGTLSFDWLQKEVRKRGMEIALNSRLIARLIIRMSRNTPVVLQTGWHDQTAEPAEKYEDIYPINFRCNWHELWAR
jgi:hypothetical protein